MFGRKFCDYTLSVNSVWGYKSRNVFWMAGNELCLALNYANIKQLITVFDDMIAAQRRNIFHGNF